MYHFRSQVARSVVLIKPIVAHFSHLSHVQTSPGSIANEWRLAAALKMKMFMGNSPPNAPCLFVLSTTSVTFAQELTLAPTIGMWYAAGGSTDLHCGAACNAGAQVQSTKRSMTGRMRTRSHLHGMRHSRHLLAVDLLRPSALVDLLRPSADPL